MCKNLAHEADSRKIITIYKKCLHALRNWPGGTVNNTGISRVETAVCILLQNCLLGC
jgi:hypothetical protein